MNYTDAEHLISLLGALLGAAATVYSRLAAKRSKEASANTGTPKTGRSTPGLTVDQKVDSLKQGQDAMLAQLLNFMREANARIDRIDPPQGRHR